MYEHEGVADRVEDPGRGRRALVGHHHLGQGPFRARTSRLSADYEPCGMDGGKGAKRHFPAGEIKSMFGRSPGRQVSALHPTMKPLALIERAIENFQPGRCGPGLVSGLRLDPGGSGTDRASLPTAWNLTRIIVHWQSRDGRLSPEPEPRGWRGKRHSDRRPGRDFRRCQRPPDGEAPGYFSQRGWLQDATPNPSLRYASVTASSREDAIGIDNQARTAMDPIKSRWTPSAELSTGYRTGTVKRKRA